MSGEGARSTHDVCIKATFVSTRRSLVYFDASRDTTGALPLDESSRISMSAIESTSVRENDDDRENDIGSELKPVAFTVTELGVFDLQ